MQKNYPSGPTNRQLNVQGRKVGNEERKSLNTWEEMKDSTGGAFITDMRNVSKSKEGHFFSTLCHSSKSSPNLTRMVATAKAEPYGCDCLHLHNLVGFKSQNRKLISNLHCLSNPINHLFFWRWADTHTCYLLCTVGPFSPSMSSLKKLPLILYPSGPSPLPSCSVITVFTIALIRSYHHL